MVCILEANRKWIYARNIITDIDRPNASRGISQLQELISARSGIAIVKYDAGGPIALTAIEPVNDPINARSLEPEVRLHKHELIVSGCVGNLLRPCGTIEHNVSKKSKGVPANERETRDSVRFAGRCRSGPTRTPEKHSANVLPLCVRQPSSRGVIS
jgi:hypothetical protein